MFTYQYPLLFMLQKHFNIDDIYLFLNKFHCIKRNDSTEKCKWCERAHIFNNGDFSVRKIFIPINKFGSHWSCVCIDTDNNTIHYYDSFYIASEYDNECVKKIEMFFEKEYMKETGNLKPKWIYKNWSQKIIQRNGENILLSLNPYY